MSIKKYTMRTHTHTNTNTNTNTQKNKPVSTHKIVSRKLCDILLKPCKNRKHKTHTIILKDNKVELLLLFSILINYFILLKQNNASRTIYKKKIIELLKVLRKNNKLIHNDTTNKEINNMYISIYKYFTQIIQNLYNKCNRIDNDIDNEIDNEIDNDIDNDDINSNIDNYDIDSDIDNDINKSNKIKVKSRKKSKQNTSQNTSQNTNHNGGFYFKSIEDKGENPITGADISKLLDEMQQFFYNAKYTSEGAFLNETDTLISMFRGDIGQFKGFLQYRIFPQYYKTVPPFINWEGVKEAIKTKKWEDLPDYLLAYQSYLRSQDEYLVEKGLKPASALNKGLYTGAFDKIAHSLDNNIQQFQQFRNKAQGKFFPIAVPI